MSDNNYPNWSMSDLLSEVAKRKLTHNITAQSYPDPEDRKRRLVYLLEGDDRLLSRHPEILKYGYQVEGYEYESKS